MPADAETLRRLVGGLHESDLGAVVEALEPDQRPRLVDLLGIDFDFTALTEVDDHVRDEILEELTPRTVAQGVRDIESDDAVTILEDLPKEEQSEILEQLPAPERVALAPQPRLSGETRPAGACRRNSSPCRPAGTSVQAIDYMRETVELPERFYELYVADETGRFLGAVPLDRLLRSKRPVPIAELMEAERRRVRADEDQEEVARIFQRYDLVAAPVVDAHDRLVGVITFDDVADVLVEEAEEDIKALGGVSRDEELSDTVWTIARSRFNWLLGQSRHRVSRLLGARPVRRLVAEDGGARRAGADRGEPGRQRDHADHDRRGARARHPRTHATPTPGASSCASCWSGCSTAWPSPSSPASPPTSGFACRPWAVVIGLAMVCNLLAAALGGILIPLALNRLRVDPAVASSPFVTTVTDVVGFFSFLSIATLWFGLR